MLSRVEMEIQSLRGVGGNTGSIFANTSNIGSDVQCDRESSPYSSQVQ